MSRILLTWELGLNLGHLARLLPIAQQLKSEGHIVLVATRDIQAAANVLVPARIPFVQAPHLPQGIALAHRPSGYADILLSQGWGRGQTLHGLTHAWLNLFRLYNPDRLVLDYSPTVSLAARIARIPALMVGNGFELPPCTDPLPPFPGFSWATASQAAASEACAVANANKVLTKFRVPHISALRELFLSGATLLATFPELDHYGARSNDRYIGPLLGRLAVPRIDWPQVGGPKIFACLRPDTHHVRHILSALAEMDAAVVCVAAGFASGQLQSFAREHIRFASGPVDLQLLKDAQLSVTYGAEGTMLRMLLAGVPQLISPWHVENYMAARRIEAAGLGSMVPDVADGKAVAAVVDSLSRDANLQGRAQRFAHQVSPFKAQVAVAEVLASVGDTGQLAERATVRAAHACTAIEEPQAHV